jgi:outer membrane receptor protein involved in Fe transport
MVLRYLFSLVATAACLLTARAGAQETVIVEANGSQVESNFQELYVVRGFPVYSDDVAYDGLYGLLPRQYVAAEFLERLEVFRGANTFLNGAAPGQRHRR